VSDDDFKPLHAFKPSDPRRVPDDPTFVTVHASPFRGFNLTLRREEMTGPRIRELGNVPALTETPTGGFVGDALRIMCPEKSWRRIVPTPGERQCPVLVSLRQEDPSIYEVWA